MNGALEYGPLVPETEEEALRDILIQCFAFPKPRWKAYYDRVGPENFRVIHRQGRVVGGLAIYFMGQWFGGRSVPMGGIAAVGVPPEARSGRLAQTLMARTLEELRERGVPLSALYASTQHLYRSVGYEQAGVRCGYEIPTAAFSRLDRSLSVEPIDPTLHEAFHDPYRRWAMAMNGCLDRNRAIWERVVSSTEEEPVYAYRIGSAAEPVGSIIFTQQAKEPGFVMRIRDWTALTPAAHARLQTFLADHRSLVRQIEWWGPAVDPLLCSPEEQRYGHRASERWLLRIVDLKKAFEMRGYPEGVEGELHLEVSDGLIGGNAGRFILDVSDGKGSVKPGGRADLRADIRGIAPLYSGMLAAIELNRIGWIEGSAGALATAARLFSGPQPWMPDPF